MSGKNSRIEALVPVVLFVLFLLLIGYTAPVSQPILYSQETPTPDTPVVTSTDAFTVTTGDLGFRVEMKVVSPPAEHTIYFYGTDISHYRGDGTWRSYHTTAPVAVQDGMVKWEEGPVTHVLLGGHVTITNLD